MTAISFFVPGEPKGKGRPRFVRATGHAITPPAAVSYENMVREAAAACMGAQALLQGPLKLTLVGYWLAPKSAPKRLWHTAKPDADNVLKIVCDAMNGTVYRDDASIVQASVQKQTGPDYGVWIQVEEI